MPLLRPTTTLIGPASASSVGLWRRAVLLLACLIAYAAAAAVLRAMPTAFPARP